MGRDIIARGMASGAIKVNINAGHIFIDNTARDAYFVTNPTELEEKMYVYCNSKLQQYDGSIWVDRTPAIKGETGTGVPTGGTTNQVLTKNSNGNYDFSWVDLSGGGDMVKSFYDTADKQVDVYDMDNMEDGTTYVRTENNFTNDYKNKIDDNVLKSHIHENKTILDNTTANYIINEKSKLNSIKKSIIGENVKTILTTDWIGSVAPYTVIIPVSIVNYTITSENDINISPVYSSILETAKLQMEGYSYISEGKISSDDTITLTCYDFKPSVNLDINIEILTDYENSNISTLNTSIISPTITKNELNTLLSSDLEKTKRIYFSKGTYTLDTVRLKSNTHLILDKNAIINVSGTHLFFNFELTDTEVLAYDGQGNITIEGGTINGHACSFIHGDNIVFKNINFNDTDNDHYFEIAACRNFKIENCHFNGMITQAIERNYVEYIQLDNPTYAGFPHLGDENSPTFDGTPNTNIYIIGNTFDKGETTGYDNIYTAIGSHGSGANYQTQIYILNNKFYNCSHAAIAQRGWKSVIIENNTFNYCSAALQLKYGNSDITFKNNFIDHSDNAIYGLGDNNSTFNFLKIDGNKFDNCTHRLNCDIISQEGVTPIINGGQIQDINNRIEDCGTDIIKYKSFYFANGNSYIRINEGLGYVILLDKTSDVTITGCKFSQITLKSGEVNFNIARVLQSYSSILINNNKADQTLLFNATLEDGSYVNTDGNTQLLTLRSLDDVKNAGNYYGYDCTSTPTDVTLGRFNLIVQNRDGYLTQILTSTYTSNMYFRTYHTSWRTWKKISDDVSMYEERTINEYDYLNPEMNAVFGLSGTTLTSTGFNCVVIPCKNSNQYTICRTKCAQALCVCESVENPIVGGNVNILLGNLTTPNYESTNTVTTTNGNFLIIFYFSTSMANGYIKSEIQKGIAIRNSQYGTAWLPYKINKADKLYGKVIAAIGDSYVKGNSLADHQTWLAKIGRRNSMTYYNRGKNGDMIAWDGVNHPDGTTITRRFDVEMPAYADIVIVFGGHNDATMAIPIGENTDTTDVTFKGALNVLIDKAITKYPKALIIFITPSYRYGAEIAYSNAMQEIALLNNIIYINTWTDFNFTLKNASQKVKYDERYVGLYDKYGVNKNHFSEEGHERMSYIVEQKIRNNIIL